jgi:hypothetical protein
VIVEGLGVFLEDGGVLAGEQKRRAGGGGYSVFEGIAGGFQFTGGCCGPGGFCAIGPRGGGFGREDFFSCCILILRLTG